VDDDLARERELVDGVLRKIAAAAGAECEVVIEATADGIHAEYVGADAAALIGQHGEVLDAIQHLAQRVAFRGAHEQAPVVVDACGHRERREEALRAMADQAAETAVREGRAVGLEAMAAGERKVVHLYLKDRHDVETYSEGEEPSRRLVVVPVGG
jgi:spoIIIJ-associated protein